MSGRLRPFYSGGPITSLRAAAATLAAPLAELHALASDTKNNYRRLLLPKDDGSFRECWDPSRLLRRVQGRIVTELLRKIVYPKYLHGSLPGRDYVSNAAEHRRARWCVCMDIRSFFPSITADLVQETIWKRYFGCSEDVASLLLQLTTLNGRVPQGSLTASYLANLVLWRHEPTLVERLQARGLTYTRYVDDITISSTGYPLPETKTYAVTQTNNMLRLNGFVQKRSKTTATTRGVGISVMGLHVEAEIGRSKRHRQQLERAVIDFAGVAAALNPSDADNYFKKLRGRIAEIGRYHSREADHLKKYLLAAKDALG